MKHSALEAGSLEVSMMIDGSAAMNYKWQNYTSAISCATFERFDFQETLPKRPPAHPSSAVARTTQVFLAEYISEI